MAERMGFEPMCAFTQTDFESYPDLSVCVGSGRSTVVFVPPPENPYISRSSAFVDTKNPEL